MSTIKNLVILEGGQSTFNVGKPPADFKKMKMKGVIFLDAGVEIPAEKLGSVASLITALKEGAVAERGSRVYPIWDLLNFTDNTGDPATGSVGNLSTATTVVNDAVPAFKFGYDGTELRHRNIAAMMGLGLDVMFVDEGYRLYATDGANGGIKGFSSMQQYVDTTKFPVADTVDQYAFRVTLGSAVEYRDRFVAIMANQGITAVQGLINVNMEVVSHVANVLHLKPIADGGKNLEPQYGAILDGLTFEAIVLKNGATLAVTSIADNAVGEDLILTLDTTAYNALTAGDEIQIISPSPAALSAANVKPYEILSFNIVK